MQDVAKTLQQMGHTVVSRWVHGDHDAGDMDQIGDPKNFQLAAEYACDDLTDLCNADCLISFNEPSRTPGRGGRHVEFGIALARGTRIILVGPRENVFHCLSGVEQYDTWDQTVEAL